MASRTEIVSPFLRRGSDTRGMMLGMMACLTLTAAHFALRYDPAFLWRYLAVLAFGGILDALYDLLRDGRPAWPRASTFVTSALLVLSVPAAMPFWQTGAGLLVAVWFGKRMADPRGLRLNPMLLGRLFMMAAFPDAIQTWRPPDLEIDTLTTATPLGLFAAEGVAWPARALWLGTIRGEWEGLYTLLPGAPGEVMPLLALAGGLALILAGLADWRSGLMYVAGFALACLGLGLPLDFHLAAGSVLFTAAYIVSDPRSMPGSKFGRLAAGLLAGILNAALRRQGFFPEGVVLAVLAVNLLSPALDRLAFVCRGSVLRFRRRHARPI